MSAPFFSILTASLNNGRTIGQTILSVRGQTFRDVEHIVADGGSTDDTLDILREHEGGYPLIWNSQKDAGISDALNKGLSQARGEYVLIIQADDYLVSDDILEKLAVELKENPCDIHCYPVVRLHPDGRTTLMKISRFPGRYLFKTPYHHQGALVKKTVFERIGGFSTRFKIAMDYDFFYRAIRAGISVRQGEEPISVMRIGGMGSSREWLRKRIREEFEVQQSNEKRLFVRMVQTVYRFFYPLYKLSVFPFFQKN